MLNVNLLRELLVGVARQRTTLPYQGAIKALDIDSPAMATLTQGLEVLQHQDTVMDRPMLAAVVVQKKAPYPRKGFFQTAWDVAAYTGPDEGTEAEMWHQDQLEKVWDYYDNE